MSETDRQVAYKSGHGVGKSYALACLVPWWLYAKKGRVITTGPTKQQVEDVLWAEIYNLVSNAPVYLPGERLKAELVINPGWYAVGITAETTEAFQGRHHPHLLVIVDEAPGVPENIHLALSTLVTGEQNRLVLIGNPTATAGTFYGAFKNPAGWKLGHISCLEHPNVVQGKEIIPGAVDRGWVEKHRKMWGENHPFWFSRVLGEFPRISNKGVIPLAWVEAQTNEEGRQVALQQAEEQGLPLIGGLDVARYGENKSVLTIRRGDAIVSQESWHHFSLMETAGKAVKAIKEQELAILIIDASGIGAGVVDRLLEQGAPVMAYNGGHRAFTPASYANRRSEMWWYLRERFEKARIWLPKDLDTLTGDLVTPEYEISSAGRIKVETKEHLLERGVASPDFADSLVLCFAADEEPTVIEQEPVPPGQDPLAYQQEFGPLDEPSEFHGLPGGAF